jgi:hypothetical protein
MNDGIWLFADGTPRFYDGCFRGAAPPDFSVLPFPDPVKFDTYSNLFRAAME